MEAERIEITRTKENALKLILYSGDEVIYSEEFDDAVLFRHVLEDLIDELKSP